MKNRTRPLNRPFARYRVVCRARKRPQDEWAVLPPIDSHHYTYRAAENYADALTAATWRCAARYDMYDRLLTTRISYCVERYRNGIGWVDIEGGEL